MKELSYFRAGALAYDLAQINDIVDAIKELQQLALTDKYRKALEDVCTAFFADGADGKTAYKMHEIANEALK